MAGKWGAFCSPLFFSGFRKGKSRLREAGENLKKKEACIEILPVKVIFKYISHK